MADIVLDHVTKRFPDGTLAVNKASLHPSTTASCVLRWVTSRCPPLRAKADRSGTGRTVVMGIRPEHLRGAAIVGDEQQAEDVTFSAVIDVLEWLGSEMYAYFHVPGAKVTTRELEELAADTGAPGVINQITARHAASQAREGTICNCGSNPTRCTSSPPTPEHTSRCRSATREPRPPASTDMRPEEGRTLDEMNDGA
jgi:hypothetical protein